MDTAPVLDATCAACGASLEGKPNQCVTDCGHVFCVACVCRQLGHQKNRCSYCQSVVKLVRQLDPLGQDASREKPCSVKFANTTYILYVSIWSVHDPTATLAELFHLEKTARLIHQGKVLKKGDVWPGAVVQLVGTRKALDAAASTPSSVTSIWAATLAWLVWLLVLVATPFRYLYLFFHSMVAGHAYTSLPSQRYAPVEPAPPSAPTFQALGRAAAPTETDHV
ncbi:hypothetical protein SDRG_12669 [Saprolegnia diclina VS20]|uniref:RING-type domain-containing protein n=1 Tax=Saprolegnia diclina (strain VS20) TaxID=1156394 RepID=T0Q867_SAPDV|nr:hypothetical protein SDRG_12669 [Saprolegnia diclina VS20]EQC29665.1 hypothetical protein SDRG_12669 [Saprolegnia diclina VS20]|eukprot:XP_008616969.1 hypothetical protein SDRG_12669 [Saprolegnia diclina VS20]